MEESKQTSKDADGGNIPATTTIVDRADSIVKRLEEAEKRLDEKTKRYEELVARNLLSGRSEAGQSSVQKPEETAKDYAKRILSGKQ